MKNLIVIVLLIIVIGCTKVDIVPEYIYKTDTVYVATIKDSIVIDTVYVTNIDTIIVVNHDTIYITIDKTFYETITIGDQEWMQGDLNVSSYSDGLPITLIESDDMWTASYPGYCYYNNDQSNDKLYNWYAVSTEKLCPKGFRVPTWDDWSQLQSFLGTNDINGGKLKAIGYNQWNEPNLYATDQYEWHAVPTYMRYYNGVFENANDPLTIQSANYWTSTIEGNTGLAKYVSLFNIDGSFHNWRHSLNMGFAVRCIKN